MISKKRGKTKHKIQAIETTTDSLTSRGGLSLFCRYLDKIGITALLLRLFGKVRKNCKGKSVYAIFRQLFCFFLDGTSRHLTYFDELKRDSGYAATLEVTREDLCSSHSMKRFFGAFSYMRNRLFRRLLQTLFIWRLTQKKPSVILLDIDTMVMDNDDADKREGVTPTYKKVKGFHPLHIKWERYIIDSVFCGGKKHCNHGKTVSKAVLHIVKKIRKYYDGSVPIILTCDSGFFDQKLFKYFEDDLKIGYVCSGKLYTDLKEKAEKELTKASKRYRKQNGKGKINEWLITEFMDQRGSWKKARRAVYTRPVCENSQMVMFAEDRVYYTNLGTNDYLAEQLTKAGSTGYETTEEIVALAHNRGKHELTHRSLKEFGFEQMPFKRFYKNETFYYTMITAFFLYEAFKEDVSKEVLPVTVYPTTFRRRLIDFAAKVVKHSKKVVLKVTQTVMDSLKLQRLWEKANSAIAIALLT